jgi:hypothetical protein
MVDGRSSYDCTSEATRAKCRYITRLEDGRLYSASLLALRNRTKNEAYARRILGRNYLNLNVESIPWILNHIDFFVNESLRGNERVKQMCLCPLAYISHDDDVWDKVGQSIEEEQIT